MTESLKKSVVFFFFFCSLHIPRLLCLSHKDPENRVRAVGYQQPRGPTGRGAAVWHVTKGNNQEGTDLYGAALKQ